MKVYVLASSRVVFLIEYDRRAGRLVSLTEFEDSDQAAAEDARLARELVLNHTRTNRESCCYKLAIWTR